jgi:hydrogenase maturation protease
MNEPPRILVAGIGNIFLGDDAFGVHVAQELMRLRFPDGIRVNDFGIRGLDLVYALLDGYDLAILIDAVPRGEAPGTLYVIEPELPDETAQQSLIVQGHSMDPVKVLTLVRSMGGKLGKLLVVGCEPVPIDPYEDIQVELSPAVRAAIQPAVELVKKLISQFLTSPLPHEVSHAIQSMDGAVPARS